MNKSDFYYDLPKNLIAQTPLQKRDESRLLVLNKSTGETAHKHFKEITEYLNSGDCLVINDTKVIPARLYGKKADVNGKLNIEILLLKDKGENVWEVMVRPGKKVKTGVIVEFGEGILKAEVLEILDNGNRLVKFMYEGIFNEILDRIGLMPLPPYIHEKLEDKDRYQTVYAKYIGSAAAPTAGLHFTNKLLQKIQDKGIKIAHVTLHVGIGTFRPVKEENILDHKMHSEHYIITKENAEIINNAKKNGNKIIACGTTSCRVLESVADESGYVSEYEGDTEIFIYPGYKFKIVDSLITNFHLPESTLIMLVSALASKDNILNAYKIAVENEYRFFSFGDAMLMQ